MGKQKVPLNTMALSIMQKTHKNSISCPSEKLGEDKETVRRTDTQTGEGGTTGPPTEGGGPITMLKLFHHVL